MKLLLTAAIALAAMNTLQAQAPKEHKDKVSYAIGLDIGTNLNQGVKQGGLDINPEVLQKGLSDGLSGAKPLMTPEEVQETMQKFQTEMQAKMQERAANMGKENKSKGDAFLAENKKKKEIVTTKSGLQYQIVEAGKGKKPTKEDTVKVHYNGTLIDGKVFDSSIKRGEPVEFQVGGVIPGWTEALQLMPVGSKWKLFIPGDLAYGAQPPPGSGIEPNSTLIFDVELLDIVKADAPEAKK